MYYRSPRMRSHRVTDYIMPFLIIICVGVIFILVFNLFKSFFFTQPSGDAYLHIKSGSVQVKMWETTEYFNLTSDALIMTGDEIQTSADSEVIVEFFDGTIMRLDGGTDVLLNQIDAEDSDPYINLMLVNGKLWINKHYKNTAETEIEVELTNLVVKSTLGNVFEVENEFDEVVRVFNGDEIVVDVLTQDGEKVVETETVGVGQEIVFTDKVLEKYWQFQSPSVLSALSDEFKQTDWYKWNIEEDGAPTEFSKAAIMGEGNDYVEVKPEVFEPVVDGGEDDVLVPVVDGGEDDVLVPEVDDVEVVEEKVEEKADLGQLGTPTVTSVAGVTETNADGFYVVTSSLATITGSISGAEDVVVTGYTLTKFNAGDSTWTYFANADYGLMQEGENTYEVYAVAPDGTKSASIFVKVLYQPPAPVVEEVVEEATDTSDEVVEDAVEETEGGETE